MGRIRFEKIAAPALALVALAALVRAQQPVFRADVKLVRLLVTAKDASGQPVGSLEKEDFRVSDSGVPQQIAIFERHSEQPLSIALLVDTSASTAKDLKYEVDSVMRFLAALVKEGNADDALSLYSFTHDVSLRSNYTRNVSRIRKALENLKAEAGTSLYDAIWFAAEHIAGRDGRHVIIVVSDGGDTTSVRTYHEALRSAHLADAVIYSIVVMPITSDAGRNIGGEHALIGLSRSTGGRVFFPAIGPALDEAFAEILRDLRTQYLVGYYPKGLPESKNKFRTVSVEVGRPGLRVSTRAGYYEE